MKKFWMIGGATAAALAAVVACSSSSGNSSTTNTATCAASAAGVSATSACESCILGNCTSQVSGYETDCSDFVSCLCPNGSPTGSTAACASKAETASCEQAAEAIGTCISNSCSSPCSTAVSNDGGGSSGGSTTLTGACLTYVTCCENYQNSLYAEAADAGAVYDAGGVAADCTQQAHSFQSMASGNSECSQFNSTYAGLGIPGCQ